MESGGRGQDCRLYERIPVSIPGEIFVKGEAETVSCTVLNLSGCGARLRASRVFSAYAPIVLYIDSFGRFDAITLAGSGDLMAVQFILSPERATDYLAALADYRFRGKLTASRRRRHPRTAMRGSGHFRRANGELIRCGILDVSDQGASLMTQTRPAVGETITFGTARGRVVRHHADGVGIFFLQPQH